MRSTHAAATFFAVAVDPVKETLSTPWEMRAAPTLPAPVTTCST